jgi:hypothetical protein
MEVTVVKDLVVMANKALVEAMVVKDLVEAMVDKDLVAKEVMEAASALHTDMVFKGA